MAPLQARLELGAMQVSEPGDPSEREADRIGNQVADRILAAKLTPGAAPISSAGGVQRKAPDGGSCPSAAPGPASEEPWLARKEAADGAAAGAAPGAHAHVGGLPEPLGRELGAHFGHDFGQVRIHTDGEAARMAKELSAEAFTTGNDVYFAAGRYAPETPGGLRLLTHELTHVVQQSGGNATVAHRFHTSRRDVIQRHALVGFSTAQETLMNAAVASALSVIASCSHFNWATRRVLAAGIRTTTFMFDPDSELCGWTFPTSPIIVIGPKAFGSSCCSLASTIAHEGGHANLFYTECAARRMECACFSCECGYEC